MTVLSKKESELLGTVLPFVTEFAKNNHRLPGQDILRRTFHIGAARAIRLTSYIQENKLVPINSGTSSPAASTSAPSKPKVVEVNEIKKDTWNITLPSTRIHTLPQLLAAFEVDQAVWEVESFLINKWDMGFIKHVERFEYPAKQATIDEAEVDRHIADPGDALSNETAKETTTDKEPGQHELYQVKAKLKRKTWATLDQYSQENAKLRRIVEKLKLDVGYERNQAKVLAQNHVGADDLLTHVGEFVDKMGRDFNLPKVHFDVTEPVIKPAVSSTHSEDAVLMLSDFHFGDRIRRADTSGFPEFDLVIGGNRFGYTIGKAKQVLTIHRAFYPIKKLYVWLGGDIGNGILHDSPNSNELFVPAQVDFSYKIIKAAFEDLYTLTIPDEVTGVRIVEEIVFLFSVGNHMRFDEKMPHKYQAQRTFDWLIYQFLIESFKGRENVTIHGEMSPFIFENIRGHRYVFFHGMQVGFRNKVKGQVNAVDSAMALIRALFDSPESRRMTGFTGSTFERACIGDIHIPLKFPRFVSNGSLNGQNELGVNWTLEPIPAGQQIFGVSDRHLETWGYLLDSTHIQKTADDMNSYGIFAAEYTKEYGR